jgi:hypothetical protein
VRCSLCPLEHRHSLIAMKRAFASRISLRDPAETPAITYQTHRSSQNVLAHCDEGGPVFVNSFGIHPEGFAKGSAVGAPRVSPACQRWESGNKNAPAP